ncbi:MAG: 4'-phosphopantetheinyl transferase superfamily protein [Bacteroides sp.]
MALYAHFCWDDAQIGIWKMEEGESELMARLPASVSQGVERFAAPHRRMEWLSVRLLLITMLGRQDVADALIGYTPAGAPYLLDHTHALSISHTKGYVAVMLAPWGSRPGIDLEQWGERVCKVASRFMREDEEVPLYYESPVAALLLHWSAKEAMYKSMPQQEAVDFKQHLRIFPFPIAAEGRFDAQEYRTSLQQHYSMAYRLYADFVLTWVTAVWPG